MLTHRRLIMFVALLALSFLMSGSATESRRATIGAVDQFRALMNRPGILDQAEHSLIGECMSRAGLPSPAVVPRTTEAVTGLLRVPSPLSVENVRRHGYPAALMGPEQDRVTASVDAFTRSLPPEIRQRFGRVLRGDGANDVRVRLADNFVVSASSTGCVGSARTQLYGSVRNYLTVVYLPQLAQRQVIDVADDPELRMAYDAYARCMHIRGYRVATPSDAVALARSYYADGSREVAGDAEIALAVADVGCQEAGRVHERYEAAADRVAIRWISGNGAAVSSAYEVFRTALTRAGEIVAR